MLIQRCGFVNDKIHTFEYLFVFNKFFDIFSYIFNKGGLKKQEILDYVRFKRQQNEQKNSH